MFNVMYCLAQANFKSLGVVFHSVQDIMQQMASSEGTELGLCSHKTGTMQSRKETCTKNRTFY